MNDAKFILSKSKVLEQYNTLKNLDIKISYSYKTNHEVGNLLQELTDANISIHAEEEIDMIKDTSRISFFTQAESEKQLNVLIEKGITNFVVDNEVDIQRLLNIIKKTNTKISLSIRMKFQEHRIGSGQYFVYGLPSRKVNELIAELKDNKNLKELGIHTHRKSQNVSEWEIKQELEESLTPLTLKTISFVNLGGGLPTKYRSYTSKVLPYIFQKITEAKTFLKKHSIQTIIEPGRFIAAPSIKLETEIIQVNQNTIVINTTIYNCALDTMIGHHKMLVENETENKGDYYLIKGNSPTRDDIFRYKVKLNTPKVGDKLVFLNAGAYNYTTDFFGYKKLKTVLVD